MPDFAQGGPIRPEDVEYLLGDEASPLAHRRIFDLPEMDEACLYLPVTPKTRIEIRGEFERPPFEFPRAPIPLSAEQRERMDEILRSAGEPTSRDYPIEAKPGDILP